MKSKVLLLGDSIRIGYQVKVRSLLSEIADVVYPEQNGRDTTTTLWQANQLFSKLGKFDLIHWNNGYWDMNIEAPMTEPFHPQAEYRHNLQRMANFFKQNAYRVIFATSLPIEQAGEATDNTDMNAQIHYNNRWVLDYNAIAQEVMIAEGVQVNDLYQFCLQGPNYYKSADHLHLTDQGYQAMAEVIAQKITNELLN